MADDDDFFGYNVAALRQSSTTPVSVPPELLKKATDEAWYSDRGNVSYEDVPDPDQNGRDIDYINTMLMGEQPATAEYRALQWGKAALLLSTVKTQLRDQTKELAETWESPKAKEIFLAKVGETLAFLDVWQEAATTNSYALTLLAQVQREVQNEMRDLYAEYQAALKRSNHPDEGLVRGAMASNKGQKLDDIAEQRETEPPSAYGDGAVVAQWAETLRTPEQNKRNYDYFARKLASRLAERYTPIIHRLESGRARKVTPLNAVNHPNAYGNPGQEMLGPPPGPPPGAPPGPPPGAPPGPPPNGLKDRLPPDKLKDKLPDGLKDELPPDGLKDKLSNNLDTPPTQTLGPVLPPPGLPPPGLPTPGLPTSGPRPLPQTPPGLSPEKLLNMLNTLGPGLQSLTSTGDLTTNAAATSQFTTKAPAVPTGPYPPNTITPPPGGVPNQQKPQGKVLGQRASQTPPPGAQGRADNQTRPANTAGGMEAQQAFQPPPAPNAPVLGNQKGKRTRPGSAKEAPAGQPVTPPNATSPVLSNRHRGTQAKTYGEQRAERRAWTRRQDTPEIATDVPTGTAPVLTGRFTPAQDRSEAAPITLRGRELTPEVRDRHAPPEIHADRTARAPQPAPEQSTWEVETPGGPVVASGSKEKQYRPEPPNALGAK